MKFIQKFTAITFLFIAAMTISSCDKTDPPPVATPSTVTQNITTGQFQISYFFKNGQTLTSDFAGYKFTFTNNGVVNAANSLLNNPGTWAVSNGSNGKVNLSITFTTPGTFVPLTEIWTVDASSAQLIRLSHISGSGSTQVTDQLVFEKI